ncbi:hypothetical protein B0H13DRAFT_1895711 [Mycena leptocephala]|nr:hypothetical protein B0H13DRAFT_1895711 [Mycena leptocephala]
MSGARIYPLLPAEIERIIFMPAAMMDPRSVFVLLLVARQAQIWYRSRRHTAEASLSRPRLGISSLKFTGDLKAQPLQVVEVALHPPAKRVRAPSGGTADDVHLAVIGREARRQYMLPLADQAGSKTLGAIGRSMSEPLFSGLLDDRLTYAQAISVRAHEALPDKKKSRNFEGDRVIRESASCIRFDKIQGLDVAKIWAFFRFVYITECVPFHAKLTKFWRPSVTPPGQNRFHGPRASSAAPVTAVAEFPSEAKISESRQNPSDHRTIFVRLMFALDATVYSGRRWKAANDFECFAQVYSFCNNRKFACSKDDVRGCRILSCSGFVSQ